MNSEGKSENLVRNPRKALTVGEQVLAETTVSFPSLPFNDLDWTESINPVAECKTN